MGQYQVPELPQFTRDFHSKSIFDAAEKNTYEMGKPPLSSPHWPFEQSGVLLAIKQREHAAEQERLKTSTMLRDVEFQDVDDEGADYSPSEDSDDEDEADSGSSLDLNEGIIDDDELQYLACDLVEQGWSSSPTPSEKEKAEKEELEEQLKILNSEEKRAASG